MVSLEEYILMNYISDSEEDEVEKQPKRCQGFSEPEKKFKKNIETMENLKFIGDKNPIVIDAPTTGLEVEYPSAFFAHSTKPTLRIPKSGVALAGARNLFAGSLINSMPDLQVGKEYVYLLLKEYKERNTSTWKSYTVTIAEANEDVAIWDLFDIQDKTVTVNSAIQSKETDAKSDLGLLILFCSAYRLASTTDPSYLSAISARIASQAVALPEEIPTPEALATFVIKWVSDQDYLKMIAGIDMFLHRFPKSIYATARIGTLASRYRDCASLISVRFFLQIIGSERLMDAAAWITYEPVAKDLIRMMKTGEETALEASYFPYQSDMGLVRKSAYSTVINPSYFFFVQAVGALLGLERSRNARMTLEYGVSGTVMNAFLVAYIHKRNHEQALQFTPNGEEVRISEAVSDLESDGVTIRSNNPVKWARFMASRNWRFTDFMKTTIQAMQTELIQADNRKGTIGEFLAAHSID